MKGSITCSQAVAYILKKEERKLSSWQRIKLWRHLTGCSLCKRFSIQNKLMTKLLSGYPHDLMHKLTEEEKEEVLKKVLASDENK